MCRLLFEWVNNFPRTRSAASDTRRWRWIDDTGWNSLYWGVPAGEPGGSLQPQLHDSVMFIDWMAPPNQDVLSGIDNSQQGIVVL